MTWVYSTVSFIGLIVLYMVLSMNVNGPGVAIKITAQDKRAIYLKKNNCLLVDKWVVGNRVYADKWQCDNGVRWYEKGTYLPMTVIRMSK